MGSSMPKSPSYPFNRTLPEVVSDTRRPRQLAETGWHVIGDNDQNVNFQNGFSGDPDRKPAWSLGEDGWVRCKGVVAPPTSPTFPVVAWTFPEEVRPEHPEPFLIGVVGGGYANGYVEVNGDVVIEQITVS